MMHRSSSRPRLAASLGAAALGLLVAAGSALGVSAPGGLGTANARNDAGPWTFTWSAPADAEPGVSYIGGLTTDPAGEPATPLGTGTSFQTEVADGPQFLRIAAVDSSGTSAYATLGINPDRVAPTLSAAFAGAQGVEGWYRSLVVRLTCSDICSDITWTTDGDFAAGAQTASASDSAGNTTTIPLPAFKFDGTRPNPPGSDAGEPLSPGINALVADEPTFSWTRGVDATSGIDRYELQYKPATEDAYTTLATVRDPAIGDPSAAPAQFSERLPERQPLDWRVVTFDKAGNSRNSPSQRLTVDPTTPDAPVITGGPASPVSNSRPTFTWNGTEDEYRWDITAAGAQQPSDSGIAFATSRQATPRAALPDGDYTFRVHQVTAAGRRSAEATRTFKVDTIPPDPPRILVQPSFPSATAPVFTWATEPGAYSRWVLLNAAGEPVAGPTDTPATSATLSEHLAEGPYTFQVWQIDPAGNLSQPAVVPFTVLGSLAPAPPPNSNAALIAILPRQNAKRLTPKAGKTLHTRSPTLRWSRGPRGTKLYNLQVFRVQKVAGRRTPKVTKVLSRFPRTRNYKAPKRILKPSTCYVWRVWPYTGRAFTPKPVGVSNFCIANARVVKRAELRAKARKKAAARAKALRVARAKALRR
ncbi:Ig-like domain repeat protein [Miltoncostaea marina]|uniref:Ig-like domain repeat protein n=1 Tax=Miltoncostaea marina TaxID=2843215 RepID=UPI001C3DAD62|nr:Ig-like domain repeat protein [Miltoncostaea marina]